MKVYYDCAPCFLRQAKEALDLSTNDENLKLEVMSDVFKLLSEKYYKDAPSNKLGSDIHNLIKSKTNCLDPYIKEKNLGNEIALRYLPIAENIIQDNPSLETYVKIAIIGNILDFGAFTLDTDIESLINESLKKELVINDIELLENDLKEHKELLYLVDNTGEIVFDKLLLSKLKEYDINITVAVKESPILNDACLSDALNVGLDEFADIVTIGTNTVGIVYTDISDDFKKLFDNADFIISKGLGNYEGLTEIDLSGKNVYFLFCIKCSAIAKNLGLNLQDMVLFKNKG